MTFRRFDPLLPHTADPGEGDRVVAAAPGFGEVRGVLRHTRHDGAAALWQARDTWELCPARTDVGGDGMAALVTTARTRLRRSNPGPDSAFCVLWPSRDRAAGAALVAGGLVPASVLAVREGDGDTTAGPSVDGAAVRSARETDVGDITDLWLEELHYSALVGPTVVREGTPALLTGEVHRSLRAGDPLWVAESDGVVAGTALCRRPEPVPRRLPGLWALVGTVSVLPALRGTGIGRALLSTVHEALGSRHGARGTYVFYSPHNALSSVFWHRQGYRPLWTRWEVRPATAR